MAPPSVNAELVNWSFAAPADPADVEVVEAVFEPPPFEPQATAVTSNPRASLRSTHLF
jgi:hypothetical protein